MGIERRTGTTIRIQKIRGVFNLNLKQTAAELRSRGFRHLGWWRNRTCHCAITAPLLLLGGAVFLLRELSLLRVQTEVVWAILGAGLIAAFVVEWLIAARPHRSK